MKESEEPKYKLYDFQEKCVEALLEHKNIIYATMGLGKNPISVLWGVKKCHATGKHKILVVSTPSKVRTQDHENDLLNFTVIKEREGIEMEKVSWHRLYKWLDAHKNDVKDYVYILDELHRSKGGVSSRMGKCFLKIASMTDDWAGFTGTPGDKWIDFYAYFVACKKIKNKTEFIKQFCIVQTFRNFPEITGYINTDVLKEWWKDISYSPDAHKALQELPEERHRIISFPKPKGYSKVLKTRQRLGVEGEEGFIDNPSALCHYLRQLSFSKEKQEWLKDFFSDTGENTVLFFNYKATADIVEEIAKKTLPKGAKVWRIDGSRHEVPTAGTIGPRDIVITQWQSGSEALNLQFIHIWVSLEPCYSFSTSQQARGRIKRIGQKSNMLFLYLIADGIEKDIYKCLKNKSDFKADVWALGQGLLDKNDSP